MRTDAQLQKDIIDELRWEPRISDDEIGVAVKAGVVSLLGYVPSFADKYLAETVVENFTGVKAIANDLAVKLPSASVRTDTDIAHQVVNALRWDVNVPDGVKARVGDGWVTLEGNVDWAFQKDAAYRSVRNLTGLRGVTNAISIRPPIVSSYDVTQHIKDSLRRHADEDAQKIKVAAKDHVVTLSGTVSSFAERRAAEAAAWSAPGVQEVKDDLMVVV